MDAVFRSKGNKVKSLLRYVNRDCLFCYAFAFCTMLMFWCRTSEDYAASDDLSHRDIGGGGVNAGVTNFELIELTR